MSNPNNHSNSSNSSNPSTTTASRVMVRDAAGASDDLRSHRLSAWQRTSIIAQSIWHHATGKFALVVLGAWVVIAIVSLFWTPQSIWATNGFNAWAHPSRAHLLGTDGTGADVLSWLMAGSATNLALAILSVAVSLVIGLLFIGGTVASHRALAHTSIVAVDALISIPTVLLALILAVPLGASCVVIVLACGIGYGLNLARVARPQALLQASSQYVESALANGASPWYVFTRHIVPNLMPVMCVQTTLSAGTSVLAEAGLTYLGIGVPSDIPSWGHSLATSVRLINIMPWSALFPGLVVTLAVIALNLFGDTLREAADPLTNPRLRSASHGA